MSTDLQSTRRYSDSTDAFVYLLGLCRSEKNEKLSRFYNHYQLDYIYFA